VNSNYFRAAGVFLLLAVLHLFLYTGTPDMRHSSGWPTIVMHNWHESGYWQLNGQLVANPGGLDAGEEKFIYPGHRPAFLILPYLLKELPGAVAGNGLLYDLVVLALTYAALLWLFGTRLRGVVLASVFCLAPGFINNVFTIDTINVPAMMGVAAMSFAGGCLVRNETKLPLRLMALGVMSLFMLLNWSTLFSMGVAAVYVFCKQRDLKKTIIWFTPALVIGSGVLLLSMHSKHSMAGATSGDFWNAYLWGPLGYDRSGMTFSKAFVRIMAVNLIAWLPLLAAGCAILFTNGFGSGSRWAFWPVLAGIAAVFALRNYNAHHPWNAVCEIGLGLIFSLDLLLATSPVVARKSCGVVIMLTGVFSLICLVGWLMLDDYNGRNNISLKTLVAQNTPRHSLLVVAADVEPNVVTDWKPIAEEFDRKVVSLDDWSQRAIELRKGERPVYLLTHTVTPPSEAKLVIESHAHSTWADKIMVPLFDFYRTKISRRAPGNRKDYFDSYRIYKL